MAAKTKNSARGLSLNLRGFRLPRAVYITICVLPAVLTALFYVLRMSTGVMDLAVSSISAPVRGFLGMLSSVYPFSLAEVFCTAAVVWLFYYIFKTASLTSRRSGKLKIISKRLLTVVVVALYVWSLYCWLWNIGYFATGFAEKNGLYGEGITTAELAAVTRLFADNANELAPLVERDENGRFIEDHRRILDASAEIYENLSEQLPSLDGRVYRPKSMMFSWLMSRMGYTGIYFALTGEANININAPGFLMPATIAHELAHQLGVFAEDEANLVAVLACVTSENTVYEYAGYLMGLMRLLSALTIEDPEAGLEISESLSDLVVGDWQHNFDYWQSQKTVNTGVGVIDTALTAVTETVSDAVDSVYDSFLRSNDQELGIKSYGAYLNLLVEYFLYVI